MSGPSDTPVAPAADLAAARAALGRGDWQLARALFEAAAGEAPTAEALEGLSWAAWWLNDAEATFAARERAYALYRVAEDRRGAARMATWLGTDHVDFRGELAVAQGWLGRARRLLEGLEPGAEHGWLWVHEAEKLLYAGDTSAARELGAQAVELGERLGLVDLQMMGLASDGAARVAEGDVEAGMARLDESVAAALGGEFRETWAVGWACCYLIQACEQVRDYSRAGQWCRRLEEWSERMEVEFLNRVCRAHYAGVLMWRGTWRQAEQELVACVGRLAELRPPMAAEAVVRLGELRRRQGRHDDAQAIFDEVAEHPLALLGLGEVCLDRGDAAGARDRAEQYLRETPAHARTIRAPGVELLVRAQVAAGEVERAAVSAAELDELAGLLGTEPLRGAARYAAGVVASARGEPESARAAFEDATRLFHRSGAPFEAATARAGLACALAATDRPRDAVRELRAAADTLRRIGAVHAVTRIEALEQEWRATRAASAPALTPRECEVLRLVAKGMSDRAIAERLVLSEHTVHRHVANILAKLRCPSRSAAVAEALTNQLI
ncbi:MAG TPA: LuxR C-terminal-related transcriptional regulator [Solirubrobacteraceae bacterium]|nr:LuxR C-terminal-related transcriptional regulator [Solirubrobacteraceae bacterium]